MYPTVCRRLCAAVVMSAAVALTGLSAQAAPPEILAVPKIGFSGRVRIGAWTPVWVDLTAPVGGVDGVLTIDASSPTGAPTVQYATPVRAAAGARARIFLPAVFHDARSPGLVHLDDARGRLAAVPLPRLRPVDEIIVALAGEPLGLESVLGGVERTELAYIAPEEIPSVWQALEGVRLMIVRDLDDRRMDEAQRQAIRRWVWTGGRLLAMPSGDDLRHLQGPTLAPLLPATVAPRRSPTPEGSVAVITPRPGSEVREAAGRRSVSWRHGRGRVTLWERDGADLARRASAEARAAWDAVLQDGVPPPPPDLEATLPPLRPVPARTQAMVGLMAVLYILAVRRLSRLAATFRPAVVIVVALAVVLASVAAARVAALASREASGLVASIVVESIPGTGHARVALLGRTATPQGTAFELRVQNEVLL
ncbi:MAG: hypothetical protein HY355_01725, partial [Armatimonadetes bacterium]|nr:hypothetical protein [Armatimonadota bacterium]